MTTIDRRTTLLALAATAAAGARPAFAASGDMRVDTAEGAVSGSTVAGCRRWLGIPFAASPVGPLRFRAPQPAPRRSGVLDATKFAAAAIQAPPVAGRYGAQPFVTSEDCLYLNVWAPQGPGPHPVYVWVHGGGNINGAAREPVFDGSAFARQGIVCVTVDYRVGALGFLELGGLLGSQYRGSGNNGLLDIVAALRWVKANIAAFGGDPQRVTLGGQSAGAKNVCALLSMPSAKGLFHRAIVESGGAQTAMGLDQADRAAQAFAAAMKASPADLLTASPDAFLAAQKGFATGWERRFPFRAVVDETHVPALPREAIRKGASSSVPLLIGTCRDEVAFYGPTKANDGQVVQSDLANIALPDFLPVYRDYVARHAERSATANRFGALTAEEYWIPTIATTEAHVQSGGKAWAYRLDMPCTSGPHAGYVPHCGELALVWAQTHNPLAAPLGPQGAQADRLSQRMHAVWAGFIHGRAPGWKGYDLKDRATMLFAEQDRVASDPDGADRKLWSKAPFDYGAVRPAS